MKRLILFMTIAMLAVSCGKVANVKYKVECAGYKISSASASSNESPAPTYYYGDGSNLLVFEWVGAKQNKITITTAIDPSAPHGVIKLYADDKLIGEATGTQPTLFVDRTKK